MKTPKYFDLEEFLTSSTARQKSIENMPSWEIVENLNELALWLDQLREDWGSGIIVSSGYRNDKLNSAVGGVLNSIHRKGFAADIYPANGKYEEFVEFIKEWAKDKKFDEIIEEKSGKSRWVHVQIYNNTGRQRRLIFKIEK